MGYQLKFGGSIKNIYGKGFEICNISLLSSSSESFYFYINFDLSNIFTRLKFKDSVYSDEPSSYSCLCRLIFSPDSAIIIVFFCIFDIFILLNRKNACLFHRKDSFVYFSVSFIFFKYILEIQSPYQCCTQPAWPWSSVVSHYMNISSLSHWSP